MKPTFLQDSTQPPNYGYNQPPNYPPPPPPPPPPQYGQSSSGGGASTKAILALVFGIAAYLFCPFIFGIVAWILGAGEKKAIEQGLSSKEGRGFAVAGMWLGIVNVILSVLGILFYLFIFIIAVAVNSN
ncbi:MAG: DUF4190 domain-containing protein [Ignavibacteria bacterium]